MKKIEKMLYTQGSITGNITAPEQLDEKLESLTFPEKKPLNVKKVCISLAAAALMIFLLAITAIGLGSSDFSGFNSVTEKSVSDAITRENAYQKKNITHTFSNGVSVTLDGIVADFDRLFIFGNVSGEADIEFRLLDSKSDFLAGPNGCIDYKSGEYSFSFDVKPRKYKNCKLQITCDGESAVIDLKHVTVTGQRKTLKLKESFEYCGTKIEFKSLIANITSCRLNYRVVYPYQFKKDGVFFGASGVGPEIYLVANDTTITLSGGQLSSVPSFRNTVFSGYERFDGLPQKVEKVEIHIVSIPVLCEQPVTLDAAIGSNGKNGTSEFEILDIRTKNKKSYVTIRGNCMFFKDSVTAETGDSEIRGKRISWDIATGDESEGLWVSCYEFDGVPDKLTVGKYVLTVNVNKTIELK